MTLVVVTAVAVAAAIGYLPACTTAFVLPSSVPRKVELRNVVRRPSTLSQREHHHLRYLPVSP